MAIVTAITSAPLNMQRLPIGVDDYQFVTFSSTRIDLQNPLNGPIGLELQLAGSSFQADMFSTPREITAGTATSLTLLSPQDLPIFQITNFAVDAVAAYDAMQAGSAAQLLRLIMAGNDTVTGNSGDDVLLGLNGNDIIRGNGGDDRIVGGIGRDTVDGGTGNDRINGGNGADNMTGGSGRDRFVFDVLPLRTADADRVTDFDTRFDRIDLDNRAFDALGRNGALNADAFVLAAAAQDAEDRIIFNGQTRQLWYDEDGTGAADAVLIATFSGRSAIALDDLFVV